MTDVQKIWDDLLAGDQVVSGRPIGRWPGGLLVASVSHASTPELVIQIAGWDFASLQAVQSGLRLNGLDIWYQVLQIGHNQSPCLVLRPRGTDANEMFFALAAHLNSALPEVSSDDVNPDAIESIIDNWADFWKKIRAGADRKKILGLVGELLTIDRWLDTKHFEYSNWQGPKGGPHDFCGDLFDIEVKVSGSRTGALKHEISSVHQLESQDEKGLFVLSFRIGLSKTGAYSTNDLVARTSQLPVFTGPGGATWLDEALKDAGYSPDIDADFSRYDIWEECLYEVRGDFPRLTREVLPSDARVFDIKYTVNFGGCQEYVVATKPSGLQLRAPAII